VEHKDLVLEQDAVYVALDGEEAKSVKPRRKLLRTDRDVSSELVGRDVVEEVRRVEEV
jgi:sulfur transfer complex TusBCD TusB component (DsrH family)